MLAFSARKANYMLNRQLLGPAVESACDRVPEELWEMIFDLAMASDRPFYDYAGFTVVYTRHYIRKVRRSWRVSPAEAISLIDQPLTLI